MKYALILENDHKILSQLVESIYLVDPEIKIRVFLTLTQFNEWRTSYSGPQDLVKAGEDFEEMKSRIQSDINFDAAKAKGQSKNNKRLSTEISNQMVIVILKAEFFKKDKEIVFYCKEIKEFFINNGLYNTSDPTAFSIVAFDNPTFNGNQLKDPDIKNIFYRPFDKSILTQLMEFTLMGYQPIKVTTLHTQKTSFELDMLKEIQIKSISEFGFSTSNDKPIEPGQITRYYSKYFQSSTLKSAFAKSMGSEPDPLNSGNYICYFSFFSLTNEQIVNMRKTFRDKAKNTSSKIFRDFSKLPQSLGMSFALIENQVFASSGIGESLGRTFANCQMTTFKSLEDFIREVETKTLPIDGVIFANSFFADKEEEMLQGLQEKIKESNHFLSNLLPKVPIFIISNNQFSLEKEKSYGGFVDEIFYAPIDRAYVLKKISLVFNRPKMAPGTIVDLNALMVNDYIKVANPIKINEISEAHILMSYYRAMKPGDFREFMLRTSNETESQELLAYCNFVSEVEEDKKKTYVHQFVYFGIRDVFLKFIRVWVRDLYIHSKKAS